MQINADHLVMEPADVSSGFFSAAERELLVGLRVDICPNCNSKHHYAARGLTPQQANAMSKFFTYIHGSSNGKADGQMWFKNASGLYDGETVDMCDGERPRRIWNWCGTAILQQVNDFRARERAQANNTAAARSQFRIGDRVSFKDRRGNTQTGIVSNIVKNLIVIVGNRKWTVPPTLATLVR